MAPAHRQRVIIPWLEDVALSAFEEVLSIDDVKPGRKRALGSMGQAARAVQAAEKPSADRVRKTEGPSVRRGMRRFQMQSSSH
jgi:hypothetical protein